jgi:hypothetical protein
VANEEIKIIIVYGTNKPLDVKSDESIGAVKIAAIGLFGIPASEQNQYILRAKVEGTEEQLNEAKTVEDYHLRTDQKVTLAAGTPFGQA